MQLPIVVAEGSDMHIVHSLAHAETELEAVDIPVYRAWDAVGRRLRLEPSPNPRRGVAYVVADAEPRQEELRQVLITTLAQEGETRVGDLPLEDLLGVADEYFRSTEYTGMIAPLWEWIVKHFKASSR